MTKNKESSKQRIAIYSRKSKFTGKGESIENQIELCKNYIKTYMTDKSDMEISVYEDEGFSGGNLERPQFKAMLKDARDKKLCSIVCYRLDRISRNIGDFAKLITELENLKISFVSIKEQFDTTSPMGRAMMYISSVFSQLERETIAERIRDNMQELAKTGRWLGGITPTGYKSEAVEKITIDGKTRRAFMLTIIPEEMEIVKTIFSKFLEFNSLTKTDTFLINNGIKTKNGRNFSRFTIRQILENPVYMLADTDAYHYLIEKGVYVYSEADVFNGSNGIMAYNKTIQKPGKTNITRDMNEWIVAVGKHNGVIAGKEFIKVQEQLMQNKSKSFRKPKSNVALLSGLLHCEACGGFMRPKMTKRKNKEGELIYDYMCELKEKSKSQLCKCKNANGNNLDKMVCNEIKKLSADNSKLIKNIEAIKNEVKNNNDVFDEKLSSLKKELNDNKKRIDNLVKSLSDTPANEYISNEINSLHHKNEVLQNTIQDYEELTKSRFLADEQVEIIKTILRTFATSFETMNIEQQRAALRTFIEEVTWDGQTIGLYLLGSKVADKLLGEDCQTIPQGEYIK